MGAVELLPRARRACADDLGVGPLFGHAVQVEQVLHRIAEKYLSRYSIAEKYLSRHSV